MRTTLTVLALSLMLSPAVYAGGGHSHGHGGHSHSHGSLISTDTAAISAATHAVDALIRQQEPIEGTPLAAAWANTDDANKKIHKKGGGYYIVSFDNTAQDKTLYILLSDAGEVYDANFSGTFEGL